MDKRRVIRAGPRVVHRHRVGNRIVRRVSELVFIQGKAKALLGWVDLGGVRTPLYICELDPKKLHRAEGERSLYYYDDTTVDPRFAEVAEPLAERRP